jgi:hypothetical protein
MKKPKPSLFNLQEKAKEDKKEMEYAERLFSGEITLFEYLGVQE